MPKFHRYLKNVRLKYSTDSDQQVAEASFNILALEYLGRDLRILFQNEENKPSVSQVLNVAYQVFEILREVHSRDIIHRDIKPANFVLGKREAKRFDKWPTLSVG